MTPWHLLLRYRYTALWIAYIVYLIVVFRLVWGHW